VAEPIRSDVQFSTAVAGFAQLLRGGQFTGAFSYEDVIKQAQGALGADPYGYRGEFVQLVRKAQSLR
jgi:Ca-activated chloride channel family protein